MDATKETVIKPQVIIVIVVVFLFLSFAGFGIFKYIQLEKELNDLKASPDKMQEVVQEDQKAILEKVSKLMVLPQDEVPTVATVTDITLVRDQPFFASAQNGDKVIIFTKAKKAILYRPSTNKIINFSSINIATESAQMVTPSTVQPSVSKKTNIPTPIRIPVASISATPGN